MKLQVGLAALGMFLAASSAQAQVLPPHNWCSDVHLTFFAGGAEGDLFATIVLNGAKQAQADTGAQVKFLFSGWDGDKMTQQLREAIAQKPDGIGMMGHPGSAAIMPLAEQAAKDGILMEYQNVDVPDVRAKFGGGYVGANLGPQGEALGAEAVRRFGVGKGDTAIVVANWTQEERVARELGTVHALEAAGVKVIRISSTTEMAGDPNLAIPLITAALIANPTVKLIAYPGGAMLGNASVYMQAAGKKPGDVVNIGFDTSPQIVKQFADGWVQLSSDQQPFMQGYLPIISLCQQKVLGLGAMTVDTGAGFITKENSPAVSDLAAKFLR